MAIEGLMAKQPIPESEAGLSGAPNVNEAVGVSLETYKALGFAGDIELAQAALTKAFKALAGLGYNGRLYARAPQAIKFSQIVEAAERKRPSGVKPKYMWPNLWVPGTEKGSYTEDELNKVPDQESAQLALFSAEGTDVDPILHHLGLPYDDYANKKWHKNKYDTTQLAEIEKNKSDFATKHPEATISQLTHRDIGIIALMDRVRGIDPKSEEFILNRGFMRVASELGRRSVVGYSVVGNVFSNGSQLEFDGSSGKANSDDGVGLSMGLDNKS